MANLPETDQWVEDLELIDATFPVIGGIPDVPNKTGGPNINDQRLGGRTRFLKAALELLQQQNFLTEPTGDARYVQINDQGSFITQTELDAAIATILNAPPSALDTLNELAAALGDNPNFAADITSLIAGKASTTYVDQQLTGKVNTSQFTAANLLSLIKSVDGGSSELDADKLDGLHASAFARIVRLINAGSGLTGGGSLAADRTISVNFAEQNDAEAGTSAVEVMSPLRTFEAISGWMKNRSVGSVGFPMFGRYLGSNVKTFGQTVSGGDLAPASAYSSFQSSYTPIGTWRCLGYANASNTDGYNRNTLWIRIN